jgi:hypothetical protein
VKTLTRVGLTLAVAIFASLAAVALLPTDVLYPDRCSTAPNVGTFCIQFDPATGHYKAPPDGVPADFAVFADQTAEPDVIRLATAVLVFALVATLVWLVGPRLRPSGRSSMRR